MGSKPVGLCHMGVCCFGMGALDLEPPDLGVNPGSATGLGSWVVTCVANRAHLAALALSQDRQGAELGGEGSHRRGCVGRGRQGRRRVREEFSSLVLWRLTWDAPSTSRCLLVSGERTHIGDGINYGSSAAPGTLQLHTFLPTAIFQCGRHYSLLWTNNLRKVKGLPQRNRCKGRGWTEAVVPRYYSFHTMSWVSDLALRLVSWWDYSQNLSIFELE